MRIRRFAAGDDIDATPALAASHASATTILRRRMSLRFGLQRARLVVTLDADDGENDDGRGFFGRVDAAEAHNAPVVWELDNGAHLAGPAVVRCLPGRGPPKPMRSASASPQVSRMQG